jgi:hypothetical protein
MNKEKVGNEPEGGDILEAQKKVKKFKEAAILKIGILINQFENGNTKNKGFISSVIPKIQEHIKSIGSSLEKIDGAFGFSHDESETISTLTFQEKAESFKKVTILKADTLIRQLETEDEEIQRLILGLLPEMQKDLKSIDSLLKSIDGIFRFKNKESRGEDFYATPPTM